jgi:hypothetical protein
MTLKKFYIEYFGWQKLAKQRPRGCQRETKNVNRCFCLLIAESNCGTDFIQIRLNASLKLASIENYSSSNVVTGVVYQDILAAE